MICLETWYSLKTLYGLLNCEIGRLNHRVKTRCNTCNSLMHLISSRVSGQCYCPIVWGEYDIKV